MRRNHVLIRTLDDESGAALVVALIMLLGLAAMAMAAVTVSSSDYVVAGSQRQRTQALHAAEAGLHEAMYRLAERPGSIASIESRIARTWNGKLMIAAASAAPVQENAKRIPKVSNSQAPSGALVPKVISSR